MEVQIPTTPSVQSALQSVRVEIPRGLLERLLEIVDQAAESVEAQGGDPTRERFIRGQIVNARDGRTASTRKSSGTGAPSARALDKAGEKYAKRTKFAEIRAKKELTSVELIFGKTSREYADAQATVAACELATEQAYEWWGKPEVRAEQGIDLESMLA